MIVLREHRTDYVHSRRKRRQCTVFQTVETSFPTHEKRYKFCHELAFMLLGRINVNWPTQPVADAPGWVARVSFMDILRYPEIRDTAWHKANTTMCALATRIEEIVGAPPLNCTFTFPAGRSEIVLKVEDARAVVRKAACMEAALALLGKRTFTRFAYIDANTRNILARMVWATRSHECWDFDPCTKRQRKASSPAARYTDSDMPEEQACDHVYSLEEDDDEEDDEEEEADSFSLHSESSEDEDNDE